MEAFLPDTHALYWHATRSERLSPAAREVFGRAGVGQCGLVLSPIVLAELYWLLKKQGVETAFSGTVQRLRASPAYTFDPLLFEDLAALPSWEEIPEMHDRLLAIQAARLGTTLLTRDATLRGCTRLNTLW